MVPSDNASNGYRQRSRSSSEVISMALPGRDNSGNPALGSILLSSPRTLTPRGSEEAAITSQTLEHLRGRLCTDMQESIGPAVCHQVLSILREELLRPIQKELVLLREAVLHITQRPFGSADQDSGGRGDSPKFGDSFTVKMNEWAERWDRHLERHSMFLEERFRDQMTLESKKIETQLGRELHPDVSLTERGIDSTFGEHANMLSERAGTEQRYDQLAKLLEQQTALRDLVDSGFQRLVQDKHIVEEAVCTSRPSLAPLHGSVEQAGQSSDQHFTHDKTPTYQSELTHQVPKPLAKVAFQSLRKSRSLEFDVQGEPGVAVAHDLGDSGQNVNAKSNQSLRRRNRDDAEDNQATAGRDTWQALREQHLSERLQKKGVLRQLIDMILSEVPEAPPDTYLSHFVRGAGFTNICTLLIISNTVCMGWETDQDVKAALSGEEVWSGFTVVNRIFMFAFALELLFRIWALGTWWLVCPDWRWNLFDFILVSTSILQELAEGVNVSFIRVFRIFRVVRVARILRVVRFFRELRRMVCAITSCMAALAWAFLLLVLIMYVFAIFFVQGVSGYVREFPSSGVTDELRYWYLNLPHTMFSLLLAISGGSDWWPMLEPLLSVSDAYRYVFAFYIVFIVFGVLNVLTGVFLESATEFLDKDLVIQAQMMRADRFVMEMHGFFRQFETDMNGNVTWEAFERCLENEEVLAYLTSHQLDCQDANTLFKLLDSNGQNEISINEFIRGCWRLKGNARSIDTACLAREVDDIAKRCRGIVQGLDEDIPEIFTALTQLGANVGCDEGAEVRSSSV